MLPFLKSYPDHQIGDRCVNKFDVYFFNSLIEELVYCLKITFYIVFWPSIAITIAVFAIGVFKAASKKELRYPIV